MLGKIGKRSLLSLLLIILEAKSPEKTTCRMKNTLADEERGELAFATESAQRLLKWMGLTREQASEFVDRQGAYYLPGEEIVEIPAVENGLEDPIFPPMGGFL